MIASDYDRCLELATRHHLVECEPDAGPVAEPEPANTCGQTLKRDAFARQVEPLMQVLVLSNEFFDFCIGPIDIIGIAGECHPTKRPNAATKERPNVGRDETLVA